MKWYFKIIIFFVGLFLFVELISLLFMPNLSNLSKFGLYNKSKYEILDEKENTIDAVFLGDSLVYSSISPMYIWDKYGYTSFDCAMPASTIKDAYEYFKIAVESQHPKIAFLESDVLFRKINHDEAYYNKLKSLKNYVPILKFHNNWKQIFSDGEYLNIFKGYKLNIKIEKYDRKSDFVKSKKVKKIKEKNLNYYKLIKKLCDENNIKLVLISNPSQTAFSYEKHNAIEKLVEKGNVEFLDLNLEELNLDWNLDTKDGGKHLNYNGSKKVSDFIGKYIEKMNIISSHKDSKEYESWNKAYEKYKEKVYN